MRRSPRRRQPSRPSPLEPGNAGIPRQTSCRHPGARSNRSSRRTKHSSIRCTTSDRCSWMLSALVAIILEESGFEDLAECLQRPREKRITPFVVMEAGLALMRELESGAEDASLLIQRTLDHFEIKTTELTTPMILAPSSLRALRQRQEATRPSSTWAMPVLRSRPHARPAASLQGRGFRADRYSLGARVMTPAEAIGIGPMREEDRAAVVDLIWQLISMRSSSRTRAATRARTRSPASPGTMSASGMEARISWRKCEGRMAAYMCLVIDMAPPIVRRNSGRHSLRGGSRGGRRMAGPGIGRALLAEAETYARQRGCAMSLIGVASAMTGRNRPLWPRRFSGLQHGAAEIAGLRGLLPLDSPAAAP